MLNMGNGFYFNPKSGEIIRDETVIAKLTGIKSLILNKLLTDGVNDYVSKDEIIKSTWGKADLVVTHSSLTQQMYLLRKALDAHGFHNYIIVQSRVGYKLNIGNDNTHPPTLRINYKNHIKILVSSFTVILFLLFLSLQ
jgi:DNA-binding winged helix-turn-helix (wHTH) protein